MCPTRGLRDKHDVKLFRRLGAGTGPVSLATRYSLYNLPESPRVTDAAPFLSLNRLFARALSRPVLTMNNNHAVQSYLQHKDSDSHFANPFFQRFGSQQVGRTWLWPVYHLITRFNVNRTLNNGETLTILSTPSHCLTRLRRPSPSTAPSHHSSLQRAIACDAPFAQIHSPAGGNGAGTY